MQLTFLGKSYSYNPRIIETDNSEFTGSFLGSTYTIRRPVTSKNSLGANRKYRGIAY